MGDPRKIRSKYEGPSHPWQRERIEQEKILLKEYGLRNKTEIWKTVSKLKHFAQQAKRLVALRGRLQAEKESAQLLLRLHNLGLLPKEAVLEDVLGLTVKDLLERRLQTLVCRKGFSKTMKQARQFIIHGHVNVAGKKITVPSFLVVTEKEPTIGFSATSAFANAEHPERMTKKAVVAEKPAAEKREKKGKPEKKKSRKPIKQAKQEKQTKQVKQAKQ